MAFDSLLRLTYYEDIFSTRNNEDAVGPGVDACESESDSEDEIATLSTPRPFRSTVASRAKAVREAASAALEPEEGKTCFREL